MHPVNNRYIFLLSFFPRKLHIVRPVSSMCIAVAFYLQAFGVHINQYCSVFVRTQQRAAAVGVALHDFLFRMPEAVAISDGKHGVVRMYGGNESFCG